MKYRFWANLKTVFQLDDATFQLLEDSMRHHYSYDVKNCVEHGGFMYGLRGRRDFHKDKLDDELRNTLELDSRKLQLCMKALEMRHYQAKALHERLDALNAQLHKLWHEMVRVTQRLNEEVLDEGGDV